MRVLLQLAAHVQKACALRCAQPFVAVPGVVVGIERADVQRKVSGNVRAVDDCSDAALARAPAELCDRQGHRGRRGVVTEEEHTRVRAHAVPHCVDDLIRAADGEPHRHANITRAEVFADVLPREVERAVLEVRRQHFVAAGEAARPGCDVHARSRVGDEDEVVGIRADVRSERRAGVSKETLDAPAEEEHGLTLELELPLLVALEHGARARAVGPVIQKRHTRVEKKLAAEVGAVRHPSYGSRACLRASGRFVRARTGRQAPWQGSSASARSRQACSSGAATATPTRRATSSRASSRSTIRSCSGTWPPLWSASRRPSRRANASASTVTTTSTASAPPCSQCWCCGSSVPTSSGISRAGSTRGTASAATRSSVSPTKAAASSSPSTAASRRSTSSSVRVRSGSTSSSRTTTGHADRLPDCPIVATRTSDYPFPDLCGTGVVYKLGQALLGEDADVLRRHLDLVALATIADVVPLVGENRSLAIAGLRVLARTQKPGLRMLMKVAGVDPATVDAGNVGFRLAPRINAAGRLGHPRAALELLLTTVADEARELANQARRAKPRSSGGRGQDPPRRDRARSRTWPEAKRRRRAYVVWGEDWHEGVIGIVASRLVERYHRPVVLIAGTEGLVEGVRPFDSRVRPALRRSAPAPTFLERFGGHRAAAGLSIRPELVEPFAEAFAKQAERTLPPEELTPTTVVDAVLPRGARLTLDLCQELGRLAPFGLGNPDVTLLAPGCELGDLATVGDGKHLRFRVHRGGHDAGGAIAFGQGTKLDRYRRQGPIRRCVPPAGKPLERHRGAPARRTAGLRCGRPVRRGVRMAARPMAGGADVRRRRRGSSTSSRWRRAAPNGIRWSRRHFVRCSPSPLCFAPPKVCAPRRSPTRAALAASRGSRRGSARAAAGTRARRDRPDFPRAIPRLLASGASRIDPSRRATRR